MGTPNQADRTRKLVEIINIINSTLEIDSLLNLVIETVSSMFDAEGCSLVLRQPDTDELYFRTAAGAASEEIKKFRLKLGEGIAGAVAQDGKPLLIADARSDKRVRHDIGNEVGVPTRSIICAPLSVEGRLAGSIEVIISRSKLKFDESDLKFLCAASDSIALAVRNAKLFSQVSSEKEILSRVLELQPTIIGNSETMKNIFAMTNKVVGTNVTILITGETGTGVTGETGPSGVDG